MPMATAAQPGDAGDAGEAVGDPGQRLQERPAAARRGGRRRRAPTTTTTKHDDERPRTAVHEASAEPPRVPEGSVWARVASIVTSSNTCRASGSPSRRTAGRYRPRHDGDVRAPAQGQRQPGVRRGVVRRSPRPSWTCSTGSCSGRWCGASDRRDRRRRGLPRRWTAATARLDAVGARRRVQPLVAARPVRGRGRAAAPVPVRPAAPAGRRRRHDPALRRQDERGPHPPARERGPRRRAAMPSPALLAGERVRLLDPACGRGTTLNRAVVYGMDAVGIELDQRDLEAYEAVPARLAAGQAPEAPGRSGPAAQGPRRPGPPLHDHLRRGQGPRLRTAAVDIVHDDTVGARTHLKAALHRRAGVRPALRRAARVARPPARCSAAPTSSSTRPCPCGSTCCGPVPAWRWRGTCTRCPGPAS